MPYLQFGDPSEHLAEWTGPWPPPERLMTARGDITGIVSIFDPEETERDKIDEIHNVATVKSWIRIKHSRMTEDTEHVVRGALYVEEE